MIRAVVIDEYKCEGCGICYAHFGCPAIGRKENGQAFISDDLCNSNGSCIQVCPVNAIVRAAKGDTKEDIARKFHNPEKVVDVAKCEVDVEAK